MNENHNAPQEFNEVPKKKSAAVMIGIICIIAGIVLLITGIIVFCAIDRDKHFRTKDYTKSFSSNDIDKLELNISCAELKIFKSEDDMIHIDAKNVHESFTAEVNGSTLSTKEKKGKIFGISLPIVNTDNNDPYIEISLPEKDYKSFHLDLGAGKTDVSGIDCGDFIVDCGAGKVTFTDVRCNTADIDCGAGDFTLDDINCEGLLDIDGGTGKIRVNGVLGGIDVDQGVGDFCFTGTMNGDIDADGGVGKMEFRLTNPSSDFKKNGGEYAMDIDTGIGSTNVIYDQE